MPWTHLARVLCSTFSLFYLHVVIAEFAVDLIIIIIIIINANGLSPGGSGYYACT